MEYTPFQNVRISFIVAFDYFKFKFNEKNIDLLKEKLRSFNLNSSPPKYGLNEKVYSEIMVKKYSKSILQFKTKGDLNEIIGNVKRSKSILKVRYYLSPKINIDLCFNKNGMSTARFDFKIDKAVVLTKLIEIINKVNDFVSKNLFKEIKTILTSFLNTNENFLSEFHEIYPIITFINSNIPSNREILGIISKYEKISNFSENFIKEKMKYNRLSIFEGAFIVVGYIATFMLFQDPERFAKDPDKYINDRIDVIEMYHSQKYLLTRKDHDLDKCIEDIKNFNTKNIVTLKKKMDKITNIQLDIQSELDLYRNTRAYALETVMMLSDQLNKVFYLDKQYKSILEKLNACDKIYQELYNELSNKKMGDLQIIVIVLGGLSVILMSIDIMQSTSLIQLIPIVITFLLIVFILKKIEDKYHFFEKFTNY